MIMVLEVSPSPSNNFNSWTQPTITASIPEPKDFGNMVYHDGLVYYFGGKNAMSQSGPYFYKYDPSLMVWTQLLQIALPPARAGASMVLAPVLDDTEPSLVLFGGMCLSPNLLCDPETYIYNFTTLAWSNLTALQSNIGVDLNNITRPPSRALHTATALTLNGSYSYMVVYGGNSQGVNLNDTWVLNLKTLQWNLLPSPSPPARNGHVAIFISASLSSAIMRVSGGCVQTNSTPFTLPFCLNQNLTDDWVLTLQINNSFLISSAEWSLASSYSKAPSLWFAASSTFTQTLPNSTVISCSVQVGGLEGGYTPGISIFQTCDGGSSWQNISNVDSLSYPLSRYGHVASYDLNRRKLLVTGGTNGLSIFNDLWEFDMHGLFWTEREVTGTPPARLAGVSGYVGGNSYFLFGLQLSGALSSDVWEHKISQSRWVHLTIAGGTPVPLPRKDPGAVTYNNTIYVFGGDQMRLVGNVNLPGHYFNDLWRFDPSSITWSQVIPASGSKIPSPRSAVCSTLYEDSFLVFGGWYNPDQPMQTFQPEAYYDELWLFNFTTSSWSLLGASSALTPLARAGCSLGTLGSQILLYGGIGYIQNTRTPLVLNDTWLFDMPTLQWSQASVALSPSARAFPGYLTISPSKFLLIAGWNKNEFAGLSLDSDVWVYDHQGSSAPWVQLEITNALSVAGIRPLDLGNSNVAVFSGMAPGQGAIFLSSTMSSIALACNVGTFSKNFSNSSCVPCAKGMYGVYSSQSGTACVSCPSGTTTAHEGAYNVSGCNICAASACSQYTTSCEVLQDGSTNCNCQFGFVGSRCTIPALGIAIGGFLLLVFIALLIRFYKRKFNFLVFEKELTEQLLDASNNELHEVLSVWDIKSQDLELLEKIGEGGEGQVWKARLHISDEIIAIKLVKYDPSLLDPRDLAKFENEMKFIRSLRHKNIVQFYGFGKWVGEPFPDMPFFATEFLERGNLAQVLHNASIELTWERKRSFATGIALGMNYLHRLSPPRMHRDLKSLNILVASDWTVKIGDFGTSKGSLREVAFSYHIDVGSDITQTLFPGSLLWSAPEVLEGKTQTTKVDVYSYGIVLWEILEQKEPYGGVNVLGLYNDVIAGLRPELSEKSLHSPQYEKYIALIKRCWDKDPLERPSFPVILQVLPEC